MSVLDELARLRVVPVLRCADAEDEVAPARAAAAGGFELVELTMTTPGVLDAAATLAADGIAFGVGTIRSADDVAPAVRAGARFVGVGGALGTAHAVGADEVERRCRALARDLA